MSKTKLIMVTKAHLPRLHTHKMILDPMVTEQFDVIAVTHGPAEAARLRALGFKDVVASGIPLDVGITGMVQMRDFVIDNVVDNGEWYISVDDNIARFTRVANPYYLEDRCPVDACGVDWREVYGTPMTPAEFVEINQELISRCEESATILGGVGMLENPFFRPKKWMMPKYVKGKWYVHKNDDVPYRLDPKVMIMSDWVKTLDTISRYGRTVVNDYAAALHMSWEDGGIGSMEYRMDARRTTLPWILEYFDGLVTTPSNYKEGWGNLRLCKRGNSLQKWRKIWAETHTNHPVYGL